MNNLPKPKATTIDLTEACNLACDYCFTWSNHKAKSITEKMAKRIIDWWLPQTDKTYNNQLSFWGGEPLLEYKLMQKLIHYTNDLCKREGYNISEYGGTTNGLLYTPDKVEWLLEHKSLFLVSLDGIQPVHDKHRKMPSGKGSWKIVDKNLREALRIAPQQRLRSSLTDDTIEYFFESIQYFVEDLGITDLAFSPVFENEWNQKSLDILEEQFDLIINYVIKKAKEGTTIILKHLNDEAHTEIKSEPQNPCGAGNGYSGWSIDGYMFPCHRFNKHGITTEERSKLPTIIARPKGNSFEYCNLEWRKEFINWHKNVPKQCLECDIFDNSVCNGGCYAVNWDLTGSLYKQPKSLCNYNKVQHEAGIKYRKLAEKENVKLPRTKWDLKDHQKQENCICYNLCYNEGTPQEIIHIDRSTNMSCVCYNTSYHGEVEPQCRSRQALDEQRKAEQRIIQAAKRLMDSK